MLALLALGIFSTASVSRAAELTNAKDTLSSQVAGTAANHIIRFTTPSGVGAGETITLTFASAFTMGSVDVTDIDVQDDGSNIDLAAAASGSTWGVAVAGQVATITSGTGTIAAGSVITINIGTNALSGPTGDAQITNPATTGSHTISIGGTFGDSKQLAVAIVGSSSVTVGATVSAASVPPSSGGGSTAPSAPTEAAMGGLSGFVIFNETFGNVSQTTATISFETDTAAVGGISYGLTPAYELDTFTGFAFETLHRFTLVNLIPGKTYFVKMIATSQTGGVETRENLTFRTVAPPDEIPPSNVSEFEAERNEDGALLTWKNPTTDDFEKVIVKKSTEAFVKNPLEGQTIFEGNLENFTDTEITAGQTIYYSIFAVDKSENISSGAIAELRVGPSVPVPQKEKPPIVLLPGGIIPAEEIIPPITVTEAERVPAEELRYFVRQSTIELSANTEHEIHVVQSEPMSISIPAGVLAKRVESILFALDGFSFFLTYNPKTAAYETTVMMPDQIGKYQGAVIVRYADGTVDVAEFTALIDPYGYVFERTLRKESRVESAEVSLFVLEGRAWVLWPAMNYEQVNPQRTGITGDYSFMVPQGTYFLEAKKEGYVSQKSDIFQVVDNVVNRNIEMRREGGLSWTDIAAYIQDHWKQIVPPVIALLIILRVIHLWKTTKKPRQTLPRWPPPKATPPPEPKPNTAMEQPIKEKEIPPKPLQEIPPVSPPEPAPETTPTETTVEPPQMEHKEIKHMDYRDGKIIT